MILILLGRKTKLSIRRIISIVKFCLLNGSDNIPTGSIHSISFYVQINLVQNPFEDKKLYFKFVIIFLSLKLSIFRLQKFETASTAAFSHNYHLLGAMVLIPPHRIQPKSIVKKDVGGMAIPPGHARFLCFLIIVWATPPSASSCLFCSIRERRTFSPTGFT